jgi:hypothetical protein
MSVMALGAMQFNLSFKSLHLFTLFLPLFTFENGRSDMRLFLLEMLDPTYSCRGGELFIFNISRRETNCKKLKAENKKKKKKKKRRK